VEGGEIDLRHEIQQKEHQVVFGQRVSWRDRVIAVLLSVPDTVILAAIVHDLAPARHIQVLKLTGTRIVPKSTPSVQIGRSRVSGG
jgi:hypothetical protein